MLDPGGPRQPSTQLLSVQLFALMQTQRAVPQPPFLCICVPCHQMLSERCAVISGSFI